MLSPLKSTRRNVDRNQPLEFAIVASRYNSRFVDAMVRAARSELRRAGARRVRVLRVPGAYEIPLVAEQLARRQPAGEGGTQSPAAGPSAGTEPSRRSRPAAIICLGVILRGETVHAAHIGEAVSRALMQIQVRHQVPVIHEVLLLENEAQARVRCLSRTHNRGAEAAQTALEMAQVMRRL
jgi:6,7-dimethyl-8-ribityllumazine synthase